MKDDPYNTIEQIENYKKREFEELPKIQDELSPEATPVLLDYMDDCKYIRFLLEAIQKLQGMEKSNG